MYHRITEPQSDPWALCVTPVNFAKHLEVLQKYSHPISLSELSAALQRGNVPRRAVVITFDDGYADNLYHAKPLLGRFGIPATFFIASGYIGGGRAFWWDELEKLILHSDQLPETLQLEINQKDYQWTLGDDSVCSPKQYEENLSWRSTGEPFNNRQKLFMSLWRLLVQQIPSNQQQILKAIASWADQTMTVDNKNLPLTVDELILLAQGKHIEIGAHTVNHSSLPALSTSSQQNEILQSKKHLEEIIRAPINHFSYPYGDYTGETIGLVRRSGFVSACTTDAKSVNRGTNPFKLSRFQVNDCDGEVFRKKLYQWFGR